MFENLIQQIAIWALPVLFAITVHEVAHGWMARRLGDRTAEMLGRLTLNPVRHIVPVGTVAVPLAMLALGGFIFGWAKPVPVAQRNLGNPRRDMVLVALAGPMSNLVMALAWALIARLAVFIDVPWFTEPVALMGAAGITIHVVIGLLNLLPVPPLDRGRIVSNLLPPKLSDQYDRLEPYGLFNPLRLMVSGALCWFLRRSVIWM